ncbi:MAG TPA: hypothetical protein VLV78_08070 [Thermoanaerobaculia bacterium]|nr:hypothetical protein [Thermoanaerobaculia bacterium]
MNLRSRQFVRLLLLLAVVALPGIGAAQLNPTVKVLPRATSPVPPECVEGAATQTAVRLPEERTVAVRDTSADMLPPPTATLRGELQRAVEAAQRNDRETFREALGRAKKLLASYPPGGERTAADQLMAVLDDVNRLGDFQFTSPTGSFFDAGGDISKMLARYPGYDAFIRRQAIVDQNGVKFYPTHESRDFLMQQVSAPYVRMTGKRMPAPSEPPRVAPLPPVTPKPPAQVATPKPRPRALKPVLHEARAKTTSHRRKAKESPSPPPAATPKKVEVPPTTTSSAIAAPVAPPVTTPKKVEVPPATTRNATAAPVAPPVTTTTAEPATATTFTTATAASTTTGPTTTTEATTTTSGPTATAETTSATDTAAQPKKPEQSGRSFFVPALLILVGLGVLVVLFRASS